MGKILLVCNDCPYPANHGGRLDILQRLKSLIELGESVDLIITHKESIANESKEYLESICENVYYIQRTSLPKAFIKSLLKFEPLQLTSRHALKNINLQGKYDTLICESEHVHYILKNKSLSARQKLLRIHNDESIYFKGLGKDEVNVGKKLYYYFESFLFKINNQTIKKEYDILLHISSDEFEKAKIKYNSIWLPPYMPIEVSFNKHKFDVYNNRILFVGNLFMPNNVGGIIWYLKNVHADLLDYDKNIKLTIAGNAKNGISSELQEAINLYPKDAIELIKSPTDSELKKIYDNHCIFINPMLNGAGVKLKNLDAMRNSFYVVTTSVGAEGTGVENNKTSVVADNPEDFRDAIIFGLKSENSEVIAHNAYRLIKNNFDIKSILKKIL